MQYSANSKRYTVQPYNRCGESGLKLPAISLGLWHNFGNNADVQNMRRLCFTAFDNGITHFDLANNYGPPAGAAERNFGRILREDLHAYRDQLLVSTKAGYTMWEGPYGDFGNRKYLMASIDQSLARMGLDYVDIFYHHRMDTETPLAETMSALADIVRSGKALYVGLSNYNGARMTEAANLLRELRCPFVINQNRYSILDRTIEENGLLAACRTERKGLIVFSPLAQGLLTDRYLYDIPADSRIHTDGRFLKAEMLTTEKRVMLQKLNSLAVERGQSLAQMALAWVYAHEGVTGVLIGASKPEQITDNLGMLRSAPFTEEELTIIDSIVGKS